MMLDTKRHHELSGCLQDLTAFSKLRRAYKREYAKRDGVWRGHRAKKELCVLVLLFAELFRPFQACFCWSSHMLAKEANEE